jgi:hypothetical protein
MLVIANLDAEAEIAGITLPERTLRVASALGTLLRVLATDDDLLWTPRPVDPARMPAVAGLARPRLVSGSLDAHAAERRNAWADTPRCRSDSPFARVAHRGFGLARARELGVTLPGSRLLRSPGELRDHLAAGGADLAPAGRWVLKAPWSAAGRWRLFDDADDERIARFFARFGEGLFEPWLRRTSDGGVSAEVTLDGDVRVVGAHAQIVEAAGRFRGIGPIREADSREAEIVTEVGRALFREGHVGPFGIDSWCGMDREGRARENPLGEVNPRLTMGRPGPRDPRASRPGAAARGPGDPGGPDRPADPPGGPPRLDRGLGRVTGHLTEYGARHSFARHLTEYGARQVRQALTPGTWPRWRRRGLVVHARLRTSASAGS